MLRQRTHSSQPKAQELVKNTERQGYYIQNSKEINERKNKEHQHDPKALQAGSIHVSA